MKKILAMLLAAIMVLSLVACTGSNTPSTTAGSETKGTERMARVALEEFRSCKIGRFTLESPETEEI